MLTSNLSRLAGLAFLAGIAATPALAETMKFSADLKGASEVPPTTSTATGTIAANYDIDSKKLSWKGTVSGLTGNATAAHFHGPAAAGKNAGVLIPVTGVTTGAFEGSATVTPEQAKEMAEGMTYFNIHTAANPMGEIRGQVAVAK